MPPITPLSGQSTIHPNLEQNNIPPIEYSDAQKDYINFRRRRMIAARDTRDQTHPEWDDMGFLQWYDIMKRADDQYVAPRKNKTDTAINTGSIRDKNTTLVEYANKFDFEPIAQCYDENDDMMYELAESGEDMVKKSLQLEEWKDKAKLIYRSMVSFGVALVEDYWLERWTIDKKIQSGKLGSANAKWVEKIVKTFEGCQAKNWDLRKCYPGDIRKYFMNGPQGQPFFFTVEYESYDKVEKMFKDWDNWVHVPNTVVMTPETASAQIYNLSWTLRPVTLNYVEIVRYYDPIMNEFAITLNGVDMLPIMEKTVKGKSMISGFPLTEISPSGMIPFAKYDLEPMHDFFYSKPQTAKNRVFGDIENMFVKLMIRMMKQKAIPTMGNKSGRNFGEEVTDPATVVNDIRDGDLFPILPNFSGPTQSDFSLYELVKKEMDKNSVQRSFTGTDGSDPTKKTATQDMNDMRSQSLSVAALLDGIISGNKQLYWLRQYNIAKNWTKVFESSIDVYKKMVINKYRTISIPATNNKEAKKIIFSKDIPYTADGKNSMEFSQKIHQSEIDSKKSGHELSVVYLQPEIYASMKLNWYWLSVPVLNSADPLSYVMFAKQINDAMLFFGPQSINVKRLKHRFAILTGMNYEDWFNKQDEGIAGKVTPGGPNPSPKSMPGSLPGMTQEIGGGNPMGNMQSIQ